MMLHKNKCDYMWICVAIRGYMSLYVPVRESIWLNTAVCSDRELKMATQAVCEATYGYVRLRIASYGYTKLMAGSTHPALAKTNKKTTLT